jgi:shikimate kinase
MNIVLIGFKNCGKTSIGQWISKKTRTTFIDTDHIMEQRYKEKEKTLLTTREIYQNKGEEYFRDLEKMIIANLDNIHNSVIATGGGSVLDKDNVTYLKKRGKLIYLYTSLETLLLRLQSQPIPAFLDTKQPEKNFKDIYNQRKNLYKKTADIEISTENKSIADISEEIILLMRHS